MATKEDFVRQLADLRDGKIEELLVEPDNFMAFQQAYRRVPFAARLKGKPDGAVKFTTASKLTKSSGGSPCIYRLQSL